MVKKLWMFKNTVEKDDELCRFVMLEDKADRALYKEINVSKNFPIKPTYTYLKKDLIEAK